MLNLNLENSLGATSGIIFLFASVLFGVGNIVRVLNTWTMKFLPLHKIDRGKEPLVAILIPTYNESEDIVAKTVTSVLMQHWPKDKLFVVVSDDGNRAAMKLMVEKLSLMHRAKIHYHAPPSPSSSARKGEAKAGNLNSALQYVREYCPTIRYIETRDADDLVGDDNFLAYCLYVLENDQSVSFVQTIKRCITSHNDPFSNQESVFYERTKAARFASNAVFPCGSGLVWRHESLEKIGDFPAWNLVEDLQSGYEAMQIGGKGAYLHITGALGQIAPEDIPNFYKQRGTWAVDTLRLFFFMHPLFNRRLTLMQRLHFFETGFSYILSFATLGFLVVLLGFLYFDVMPVTGSMMDLLLFLGLYFVLVEAHMLFIAKGLGFRSHWRSRQIYTGLLHVFIRAAFIALRFGRNKKPNYVVTRKYNQVAWYWKEVLPQTLIVISLIIGVVWSMKFSTRTDTAFAQLWALYLIMCFYKTVQNGWFGLSFKHEAAKLVRPVFEKLEFSKASILSLGRTRYGAVAQVPTQNTSHVSGIEAEGHVRGHHVQATN